MEDHEEVLVDLQGYGSGIGSWGSVGGGKSKDSSRGRRRERKRYVDDGDDEAADSEHSRSSSQRSDDEEEEEEKEGRQAGGRNGPARGAATASRPKVSNPQRPQAPAAPPRSALTRAQAARADEQTYHPGQVSRRMIPLSTGPESPKTTKEKPRFRFRRGLKAYMNDFLDYKVDELVEYKVEKRLALGRSQEPGSGPALGLVNGRIKFVEDVDAIGISVPGPMKPLPKKVVNKRPVPKVAHPERPRASKGRQSSRYRVMPMAHVPALYRVGRSSRRRTRSPPAKSRIPEVVVDEPDKGNPDAEERGGKEEEWVDDDVEEPKHTTHPAKAQPPHISWDIPHEASDADSMAPNDGFSDADDDVHKDIGSVAARIREFRPAPDAAAFNALRATVEEAESSDDASVDPEKLVRDLWPRLGPPRRPLGLNKRHGFVEVRTV